MSSQSDVNSTLNKIEVNVTIANNSSTLNKIEVNYNGIDNSEPSYVYYVPKGISIDHLQSNLPTIVKYSVKYE